MGAVCAFTTGARSPRYCVLSQKLGLISFVRSSARARARRVHLLNSVPERESSLVVPLVFFMVNYVRGKRPAIICPIRYRYLSVRRIYPRESLPRSRTFDSEVKTVLSLPSSFRKYRLARTEDLRLASRSFRVDGPFNAGRLEAAGDSARLLINSS